MVAGDVVHVPDAKSVPQLAPQFIRLFENSDQTVPANVNQQSSSNNQGGVSGGGGSSGGGSGGGGDSPATNPPSDLPPAPRPDQGNAPRAGDQLGYEVVPQSTLTGATQEALTSAQPGSLKHHTTDTRAHTNTCANPCSTTGTDTCASTGSYPSSNSRTDSGACTHTSSYARTYSGACTHSGSYTNTSSYTHTPVLNSDSGVMSITGPAGTAVAPMAGRVRPGRTVKTAREGQNESSSYLIHPVSVNPGVDIGMPTFKLQDNKPVLTSIPGKTVADTAVFEPLADKQAYGIGSDTTNKIYWGILPRGRIYYIGCGR